MSEFVKNQIKTIPMYSDDDNKAIILMFEIRVCYIKEVYVCAMFLIFSIPAFISIGRAHPYE
jgi:hypothetical protein